jgi:hypothetical protein
VCQWEYRRLDLTDSFGGADDIALLNEAGTEGWELVRITTNNVAYLKRPLVQPTDISSPSDGTAD